jgi:hypothetical protein
MYLLLFLVLVPRSDVEATHQDSLTAAVIAHRSLASFSGALVDNAWLSVGILLLFGVWCFLRRSLTSFVLPVALMVGLYVYADGWSHQQGTIFLAMVTGLAVAWPTEEERLRFDRNSLWSYKAVVATLAVVLCYQAFIVSVTIRNDVRLPYSGAADMAKYLQSLVAEGKVINGYQYGMVAINADFDHNIFANWQHAYYHHAMSEFDQTTVFQQMRTSGADYIVLQWWDPWNENKFSQQLQAPMGKLGYSLDHFSDGYLLTKGGYTYRQIYLAFKKSHSGSDQTQSSLSAN